MRNFVLLFLFVASVRAVDDTLIHTADGPKSSHDLIAGAGPSPDVLSSSSVKVAGVPSEVQTGQPHILEKPEIVPATHSHTGLPHENVAPANTKADKLGLAALPPGEESKIAVVSKGSSESREKRSAESSEEKKDLKSDVGKTEIKTKEFDVEKVPKEQVAVAHKKEGEEPKVAVAEKSDIVAKEKEKRSAEVEEEGTKYTSKVPLESAAVVKKKPGEDKAEVATATKVENKEVEGNPADKGLPTASPDLKDFHEPKKEEVKEEVAAKKVEVSKVPTEEVAVAKKKPGEEPEVVTATKSAIVAKEVEKRDASKEEVKFTTKIPNITVAAIINRRRRHSEPNSASHEKAEPSPLPASDKGDVETIAIASKKAGETDPSVVAISKTHHEIKERSAGPSEGEMAAGDPVKLEKKKPKSRARRYA